MKKIISILLAVAMVLSLTALVGCADKAGGDKTDNKTDSALKLGLGVYSHFEKITSADGDTNGEGKAVTTAAAVLIDADGKIVKCALDSMENKMAFTSDGKFVEAGEFKTKHEQGKDYGMVAYGNAKKEWFEQIDALEKVVEGKTADQVKALMAGDSSKGNDEVVKAGCTVMIHEFINALDKAFKNAEKSDAKADNNLKVAIVSTQTSSKEAKEDAVGMNEVDTTVVAAATNKAGKVTASATDALQAKLGFDIKGTALVESNTEIKTKRDLGESYGMVAYAKADKEWFEQADAFDAALKGKNADEIAKLAIETGYGADSLQKAGCTIHVGDMVKAAVKAAKA